MTKDSLRIGISGASGFIGSNLCRRFQENSWEIIALGRKEFSSSRKDLAKLLEGVHAIVNLAGSPVACRWNDKNKKKIYQSRVILTQKLVNACMETENPPKIFLSASAIGRYSTKGFHTEDDNVCAEDFLGNLTRDWEKEAFRAKEFGSRTAVFRLGVVLGRDGGALDKMLLPFKLGFGGTIGNGAQAFSWIHIKDLLSALELLINDPSLTGVYNMTSPNPTTNFGLTKTLGKVLARPTIMRVPEFVLSMVYGEGAQILSNGQAVIPKRLLDSGFKFSFPDIEEAIFDCLRKK